MQRENIGYLEQLAEFMKRRIRRTWKFSLLVFMTIVFIAVALLTIFVIPVKIYNKCDEANEINQLAFVGTVIEKKDSDPISRSRHLVIRTQSNSEIVLNLLHDRTVEQASRKSFLWYVISKGDSIRKESETFKLSYQKEGVNWKTTKLGYKLCE